MSLLGFMVIGRSLILNVWVVFYLQGPEISRADVGLES